MSEVALKRSGDSNPNCSSTTTTTTISSPLKKAKRRNERNILTFYEKIAVIRYYDETNISRNSLAKMFHCCATQIRRILERKEELLQQLATLSEADASIIIEEMTRKRRKFEMSAISFILHQWVERCRQLRLRKSITNQTLKETALKMAAILNLPSFRPSYRWLNRFRGKYKYNDEDLGACGGGGGGGGSGGGGSGSGNDIGAGDNGAVSGELSVEDIIIEYKDSLPSFMQKEIFAITSSAKVEERLAAGELDRPTLPELPILLNDNSLDDHDMSEEEQETTANEDEDEATVQLPSPPPPKEAANDDSPALANGLVEGGGELRMNAGTSALLNSIFPHLAVIHQFALLNSDVEALDLISKLGVHMQTQAAEGAYKQLSLATATDGPSEADAASDLGLYPDIDDIVLIE